MCGIVGKLSYSPNHKKLSEHDIDRLCHRGPDDRGIYHSDHISLGHVRLSIIDLSSAGHQPMQTADGRYVIVYNGEIYNYPEVKEKLKAEGVSFSTQTDTEILLMAYIQWKEACLKEFCGMFSFLIWDHAEKKAFMARDRCGEKPFIFYFDDQQLIFASEFKTLIPLLPEMPVLNPEAVDRYLHYQYSPEPTTLLKNVQKLPAAHYALLDVKSWSLDIKPYWALSSIDANKDITLKDIGHAFEGAVQRTLKSDVPVGIALSAGIDSGAIAAIAKKYHGKPMHCFSVGYPKRPPYDERLEAKALAENIGHIFHEIEIPTDHFIDSFADFVPILDEPIADIAAFGHYTIPKFCSDAGLKVLLTGTGGDELFWGYDWTRFAVSSKQHKNPYRILAKTLKPPFSQKNLYVTAFILLWNLSQDTRIPNVLRRFYQKMLAKIENRASSGQFIFKAVTSSPPSHYDSDLGHGWYGSAMNALQPDDSFYLNPSNQPYDCDDIPTMVLDILFKTWLVSNSLNLADHTSMAVGVEIRLPFLDVRFIETVMAWRKCNPDHALGHKAILREILKDVLPEPILNRHKSGFKPPIGQWLTGIIDQHHSCLKAGHLMQQGIISENITNNLPSRRKSGMNKHVAYRLILLELWYRHLVQSRRSGHTVGQ